MHPAPTTPFLPAFGLALLLGWAVLTDLRWRRIPNLLVLSGLMSALATHGVSLALGITPLAGPQWWSPLAGLAAGFALMTPLHLLRAMGAGDVKLMAMVGAFIGPAAVFSAFVFTLLAGGLLALVFMLGRGVAAHTMDNLRFMLTDWRLRAGTGQGARLAPLQTTAARLPYALAIATGTGAAVLRPLVMP